MGTTLTAPRHILITGGSSGIGRALAEHYAASGVRLTLNGRNSERLAEVARICQARGAVVDVQSVDVCDAQAMADWIAGADAVAPLDLVIANAGISGGTGGVAASSVIGGESAEQARAIFATNLAGVINTVYPALAVMGPRRRGQLALVASVAGFRGLPSAPAYCASKAAVKVWGEGLRGAVAADGIAVSVILPGFVESRITDANTFKMPLLMPAERAARIISKGLARNRGRIAFPWPTVFGGWLLGALPDALIDGLGRLLPKKP